ncbi:MAG: M23 family metallopeptidase [Sulfurimonas sp.]|nr:M23 family metallopeptidase [Sulfurimonas sp.]MDQ7061365.1 M23 family metallopeptidase [Sulfurimonas sp.]
MAKSKSKSGVTILLLGLIIGAVIYVYTSSAFERDAVKVTMNSNGYWNLKKPLNISLTDESGIKSYKLILKSATSETVLEYEQFIDAKQLLNLEVKPPRSAFSLKENELSLILELQDASSWNFLSGNSSREEFKFIIDKKRPQSSILSNSYKITKGGSALVIFKVLDDNLKEIYIESDKDKRFTPQSFYKDGYYISLLAWPITNKTFKATIVAKDHAGNISKTNIPLYLKQKNYRVSNITLSDKFLKGKIADLAEEFIETQGLTDSIEQFKIINEDVRAKNEKLIHELSSKTDERLISNFKINKMYPLKNAKVVANFGDHRKYFYKKEKVSESYHLGLDLASNAMASIKPQNAGEVVYSDYNGLYGNMPMIHHGLGLYTLYGHCSSVNVNEDEHTDAKANIANTGKSGYAMGDHLHFGVLVQGIEVRPQEWMDEKWIKLNITDIIKNAKDIMNKN